MDAFTMEGSFRHINIVTLRYRISDETKEFCTMELSSNSNSQKIKSVMIVSNSHVLLYADLLYSIVQFQLNCELLLNTVFPVSLNILSIWLLFSQFVRCE